MVKEVLTEIANDTFRKLGYALEIGVSVLSIITAVNRFNEYERECEIDNEDE